jgi:energy-converting hydrogenase Eha subunit B
MTILSTIMGVESSGGHNVTQGNIGDINNQTGDLAQGYFQITGGTWAQFGGLNTGYTQANQAPYATQLAIAQNIPVSRWGPATQTALANAGYTTTQGQTLGQLMGAYNESPSATTAADGSTVTGSGSTIAQGPADNGQGSTPASGSTDPLGTSVTQNPTGTATTSPSTSTSGAGTGIAETQGLQQSTITAIQGWITGIENSFGSGMKAVVSAAETSAGTWLGSVQNWFTRAGLIILGIVIAAIALVVMLWDHGGKEMAGRAQMVMAT